MAFGALVAITSVLLTDLLRPDPHLLRDGRDGLMPRRIAKVNPRTGTPVELTIGFGILIAVLAALVPLSEIVKLVNIGTLFAFLLVNIGVIVLRRTHPDMERPFRVPFVPVFPIIGMLLIIYLMIAPAGRDVDPLRRLAGVGLLIYYFYGRKHSRLQLAAAERAGADRHERRIVIGLDGSDSGDDALTLGAQPGARDR